MWPFNSSKPPKDTTLPERVLELEKRIRRLEEEWTEVYGKFRTLQMRVAKQVQRADQQAPETGATEPGGEPEAGNGLSSRQQVINAQIMARRNRLLVSRRGGE